MLERLARCVDNRAVNHSWPEDAAPDFPLYGTDHALELGRLRLDERQARRTAFRRHGIVERDLSLQHWLVAGFLEAFRGRDPPLGSLPSENELQGFSRSPFVVYDEDMGLHDSATTGLSDAMTQFLCGRLRKTMDFAESVALYNVEARLARLLVYFASRHGAETKKGILIDRRLPQGQLGMMINAARPNVNIQLQAWRRAGIVDNSGGRILITDMDEIRARAQMDY